MSGVEVRQEEAPFDPGLQVERTLLAWRRTTLTVAGVSAASVRFTVEDLGACAGIAIGTLGIGLALCAYLVAGVRYRQVNHSLNRSTGLLATGWAQAGLTAASVILGLVALAAILWPTG